MVINLFGSWRGIEVRSIPPPPLFTYYNVLHSNAASASVYSDRPILKVLQLFKSASASSFSGYPTRLAVSILNSFARCGQDVLRSSFPPSPLSWEEISFEASIACHDYCLFLKNFLFIVV